MSDHPYVFERSIQAANTCSSTGLETGLLKKPVTKS